MHALIIKELKERKTLIIVSLCLCFVPLATELFTSHSSNWMLREAAHPVAFLTFVLMAFAIPITLAESMVAGEIERNTLSFLFSLPVSRRKIWCAKATALFAIQYGIISSSSW